MKASQRLLSLAMATLLTLGVLGAIDQLAQVEVPAAVAQASTPCA